MNLENKQEIECTLFPDAFHVGSSRVVTLRQYFECVTSEKYRNKIHLLRAYLDAGEAEEAGKCKKELPLLVPGGIMEGGRKQENMVSYSGCLIADLDDVPGSPQALLRQAEQLTYTKAGHISPSGRGIKLFILVDSGLAHHPVAFEMVRRRVEVDLPGVTVDVSGKDSNRGCFVSYDPTAFYKGEAEKLSVPVNTLSESAAATFETSLKRRQGDSLSNYMDKFENGNPFTGGNRHSYVVKLSSLLNNAGFDEREVTDECLRRYIEPGFAEKEIRTTVADVYSRYRSSHGSNPYRLQQDATGAGSLKSLKNLCPIPENGDLPGESPLGFDIEPGEAHLPHFDKALLGDLPPLLADVLKDAADDTEYDLMLLAALTAISTALPGVTGMLMGEIYYPPFYTLLIGPSGSGKGCISRVHKLVGGWQRRVYDNSHREVEEYKKNKEACELYKIQQRQAKGKKPVGLPPEDPQPVCQKQLHLCGYTTTARMGELLEANSPYASLLFETELESINNTLTQDFGGYGYILNQAFQHECVGNSSKTNGSALVSRPQLGLLGTGTPGMLLQLVPSTENGLYSRLLIYRITGKARYHALTSADNLCENAFYFDELGIRMQDIAVFLEGSPTFVSFTDAQRKKLDRYFEREYYNVRVFGNDDITSVVLRHRLILFRICMVLTALRKGEGRIDARKMVVSDTDFEAAFHIGTYCLRHSMSVSTTMKHSNSELHFKVPTAQRDLFAAMPVKFETAMILQEACVRGISRASVFRMLKKAQEYGLLVSLGAGCYQKTDAGKNIVFSEIG
ncbi:DUF3987 domain-containing protein [Parabacteroides faecis]|uniref:DUF3987 domain-containing protein n=1 Tax=Parabacteroides faecis TaxID=1217282 RepID=UPI0021646CEC|nr:DUF3987 domain-containing protein [Parabacteroides faecis]MCS2891503.1 DUF3987 domain-containing protein [Parabacteroides faecis]UVQ44858.1 DUF3987 domain-containing protein [Parabacteroides faecis]